MSETEAMRQEDNPSRMMRRRMAPDPAQAYAAIVATPWAGVALGVSVRGEFVTSIDFLAGNAPICTARVGIAREAVRQLQAYFRDPRYRFILPLELTGTLFQRKVWDALRRIPAGTTRGYGEVAQQLGSGARAVGGACRANPIPVVIPCHRIVAAHGLGGFMGATTGRGLHIKQQLLAHELPA
jgi:methylated-DNA-[protein]-cysteine S-methyltransferase